ncbi:MAG: amidohydrolase family protein, partial [Candidatus Bathyarchaeia archaeon]
TAKARLNLPAIDREYSLHEIATITRAATAKSLGLEFKGHLGLGADADIAIYDINPPRLDPARDYKAVRKAFAHANYTVKDGRIVVKRGEVVRKTVMTDLESKFDDYYTVRMANYPIEERYLTASQAITTNASV